jgi:FKBP-type peptidyl-prolyl cis-trans isomerase FklB
MKWKPFAAGAAALVIAVAGVVVGVRSRKASANPALNTAKEKLSYTAGVFTARALKDQGADVDIEVAVRGLRDGFSGKLVVSEDTLREILGAYEGEQKQKQADAIKRVADTNKIAADAFLAENAKSEGVVSLPSGLQYKILKAGEGKRPTDTDTVECHYRGIRIDGKEFQSSYAKGQPASVPVGSVIRGWNEALKLMPVGSTWKVFVPPQLAYGERGVPGRTGATTIGPNEPLIFELELLAIKSSAAPVAQKTAAKAKGHP